MGEGLVIFPLVKCKVAGLIPRGPIVKGLGMDLEYLFMVFQPNLSALEQSWLHDSPMVCAVGKIGLL